MGLQVAAAGKIINEFTGLAFAGGEFETDNPAIRFVSAEAWTANAQGAHITFATAPIGTSSPVEGMRLTSEGILLVGTDTASGSAKLQVSGAINVSGITYAGTLFTINGDGTATLYNETATTGSTSLVVRAGAGQSTTKLLDVQNNAGTSIASVAGDGSVGIGISSATLSTLHVYKSSMANIAAAIRAAGETSQQYGYGIVGDVKSTYSSAGGQYVGHLGQASVQPGSGAASFIAGTQGWAYNASNATVASAYGVVAYSENQSSGVITDAIAIKASSNLNSGAGSITNNYGVFVAAQSAGSVNTGIHLYATGNPGRISWGNNSNTPDVWISQSASGVLTVTGSLDIAGPSGIATFQSATPLGLFVRGASGTTDHSGIDFAGNGLPTSQPIARIAAIAGDSGSMLKFGTSNSYASGITNTALAINYTGNVLVGTTADDGSSRLQVAGTATAYSQTVYNPIAVTGSTSLVVRAGAGQGGNPLITIANAAGDTKTTVFGEGISLAQAVNTDTAFLQMGYGRTGSGYAYIDLIGDATYTSYGLRIIRGNGGANATTNITHRGTGSFVIEANENAPIVLSSNTSERFRVNGTGIGFFGATPVAKQTVTADAASILAALQAYGLAV